MTLPEIKEYHKRVSGEKCRKCLPKCYPHYKFKTLIRVRGVAAFTPGIALAVPFICIINGPKF